MLHTAAVVALQVKVVRDEVSGEEEGGQHHSCGCGFFKSIFKPSCAPLFHPVPVMGFECFYFFFFPWSCHTEGEFRQNLGCSPAPEFRCRSRACSPPTAKFLPVLGAPCSAFPAVAVLPDKFEFPRKRNCKKPVSEARRFWVGGRKSSVVLCHMFLLTSGCF